MSCTSAVLRSAISLDASSATRSLFCTLPRISSAQGSMPAPLYTNRSASSSISISCVEGSHSCGSVPAGIIIFTATLSPPILFAKSYIGKIVATTLTLPSASLPKPRLQEQRTPAVPAIKDTARIPEKKRFKPNFILQKNSFLTSSNCEWFAIAKDSIKERIGKSKKNLSSPTTFS